MHAWSVTIIVLSAVACSSSHDALTPTANWPTCESWKTTPVSERMLQHGCLNAAGELTSARLISCGDGRAFFVGEDFEGWLGGVAVARDPRAPRPIDECPP